MAPQPETRQAQRIEQVEEAVADLRGSMMAEVAEAVNRAASDMQQTLISQITSSLDQVTQKLQVQIDRVRENNETLISEVTKRQEEFQSEVRSTLSSILRTTNSGATGSGINPDDRNSGDQMNMEEDPVHSSNPTVPAFGQPTVSSSNPAVPAFGQSLVSPSPPGFMFGSAAPSSISSSPFQFQFGGQQNQATPQNLPSFPASNSPVNSGWSFSLGGDNRSSRKMVRVSKNRNRRK